MSCEKTHLPIIIVYSHIIWNLLRFLDSKIIRASLMEAPVLNPNLLYELYISSLPVNLQNSRSSSNTVLHRLIFHKILKITFSTCFYNVCGKTILVLKISETVSCYIKAKHFFARIEVIRYWLMSSVFLFKMYPRQWCVKLIYRGCVQIWGFRTNLTLTFSTGNPSNPLSAYSISLIIQLNVTPSRHNHISKNYVIRSHLQF